MFVTSRVFFLAAVSGRDVLANGSEFDGRSRLLVGAQPGRADDQRVQRTPLALRTAAETIALLNCAASQDEFTRSSPCWSTDPISIEALAATIESEENSLFGSQGREFEQLGPALPNDTNTAACSGPAVA